MAKKQKPATIVMTDGKREIIRQLLSEYDIKTAEDIQEALKDLLGGTIKEMMEAEMGYHLGYEKSARSNSDNARNGYKSKRVNSSYGNFSVEVPQDRNSTFEPQIVPKRKKDISTIDQKIINFTVLKFQTALSATLQTKFCRRFRSGKVDRLNRFIP